MPRILGSIKPFLSHARMPAARKQQGRVRLRPLLEPLEGRSLPATFTAFPLPTTAPLPANITKGPDGNLWFTEPGSSGSPAQIGKVTTSGSFTFYPLPTGASISSTDQITAGPDGNLWFTETSSKIGKISTSGQVQEFTIPSTFLHGVPLGITAGPDGNVWFVLQSPALGGGGAVIGKITPSGQITEFPLSFNVLSHGNITQGADGNLWFTIPGGIAKITTTGVVTSYPISSGLGLHLVYGITAGPGGNIWFLETVPKTFGTPDLEIGTVTPGGQITEYLLITDFGNISSGGGLTTGQDGKLYLTENNQIGQVTPNPFGSPTFAQIPNPNAGALNQFDEDITVGPDGNIWYTQQSFSAIVKLDVNGSPTPTLRSITVIPASPSIAVGATQQFTATGIFSDNSTQILTSQVTWASATPTVATISPTGLARAVATGTSSITASLNGVTGATLLTVTPTPTPTLQSITVTPANPSITVGATQQFTAFGTFSDNSTQNLTSQVTWASATPSVTTISTNTGLATAVAAGTSSITATLNGVIGATPLTVTPPPTPPSVTRISGTRTRRGITAITVGFDEALDPPSAMNPAFYSLALVVKMRRRLVFRVVRVGGIPAYNGADHSVTIRLAKPTKGRIRVTVQGGIRAANGAVSSGNITVDVP
jgi:virginiamycin B lyase